MQGSVTQWIECRDTLGPKVAGSNPVGARASFGTFHHVCSSLLVVPFHRRKMSSGGFAPGSMTTGASHVPPGTSASSSSSSSSSPGHTHTHQWCDHHLCALVPRPVSACLFTEEATTHGTGGPAVAPETPSSKPLVFPQPVPGASGLLYVGEGVVGSVPGATSRANSAECSLE
jgi:hypothetical protein